MDDEFVPPKRGLRSKTECRAPAHIRYLGAWGEVNQRIAARAQLNIGHIAMIVALATAYVTSVDSRWIPAFFMPIVSWIFVSWYRHNEGIIGTLSLYCSVFEKLDREEGYVDAPWFLRTKSKEEQRKLREICIQDFALIFRTWNDRATQALCAASPILTTVYYIKHAQDLWDRFDGMREQKFTLTQVLCMAMYNIHEVIELLVFIWCIVISFILIKAVGDLPVVRGEILRGSYDENTGLFVDTSERFVK